MTAEDRDRIAGVRGDESEVAWRIGWAERLATGYAASDRVAAVTVAGSVGAGLADRWSDLELDCYWLQPPTDTDRRAPAERVGAVFDAFWDYDPDDREWSEDYRVGALPVTISNFTVDTVEQMLDAVIAGAGTDPVMHMRLAALQRCRVLHGAELVASWRSRAGGYPDALVSAMVRHWLAAEALAGWSARDALVERGDQIALHALLCRIETAVLGTVLALNRIYLPHRVAKWQRSLLAEVRLAPDDLAERMADLWRPPMPRALAAAEALLTDMVELAVRHSTADLTTFRDTLAERRQPLKPPPDETSALL